MDLPFKLIATDFDGTLHTDLAFPPVPVALQERIRELQEQGVQWVVNTGRDLAGLLQVMDAAGLRIQPDHLVVVEREIHSLNGHGYISWEEWNGQCHRDQQQLFARIDQRLPQLLDWIHQHYTATIYQDAYSPFCLIAANNPDADAILVYVDDFFRNEPDLTVVRNDIYARFSHVAYNKGTSLAALARKLGIPKTAVFAAGDHYNDLPMLSREHADWLVAPANAIPPVKESVLSQRGYVSAQSHGHGVLEGLNYFLSQPA